MIDNAMPIEAQLVIWLCVVKGMTQREAARRLRKCPAWVCWWMNEIRKAVIQERNSR